MKSSRSNQMSTLEENIKLPITAPGDGYVKSADSRGIPQAAYN